MTDKGELGGGDKISIVVTVHNNEQYLTDCIMSVIKQTYKEIELILVDDGSMDRSGKICDVSAETSGRTKVIHKECGGVVSAWKAGVQAADGNYICFLDGDDTLDPGMIEDMAQYLTDSDSEIVVCDYLTEYPNGKKEYHWNELTAGEYDREKIHNVILPNLVGTEKRYMNGTRCAKLFSKKLLTDNMQYTDERIVRGEDIVILLPCLADAERVFVLERKAYYHHRGDDIQRGEKYDTKLEGSLPLFYQAGERIVEEKFTGVEKSFRASQLDVEYLLGLLAFVRNEALHNPVMYRKNIAKKTASAEVKRLLADTEAELNEPENKAAYRTLRHPNPFNCTLLRLYLLLQKRRKEG